MTTPNNKWFDHPTRSDRLVSGDVARAEDINRLLDAVSSAFTNVESILSRTITLPDGAEMSKIAEALSERSNRVFAFDASGSLMPWPAVSPVERASTFIGWGEDGRIKLWPAVSTQQIAQAVSSAESSLESAVAARDEAIQAKDVAISAAENAANDAAFTTENLLRDEFLGLVESAGKSELNAAESASQAQQYAENSAQSLDLARQSESAASNFSSKSEASARSSAESLESSKFVLSEIKNISDNASAIAAEQIFQSVEAEVSTAVAAKTDAEKFRDQAMAAANVAVESMLSTGTTNPLNDFSLGILDGIQLSGIVTGLSNLSASEIDAQLQAGFVSA